MYVLVKLALSTLFGSVDTKNIRYSHTTSTEPSWSSQLNNSLMKSVPNSIISTITHSGIGIITYPAYQLWPTHEQTEKKKKMKSNQNSQGASIPLEIEKCQFYVARLLRQVIMYILHVHFIMYIRAACSMLYAHRETFVTSTNQRGSKFHLILEFWLNHNK